MRILDINSLSIAAYFQAQQDAIDPVEQNNYIQHDRDTLSIEGREIYESDTLDIESVEEHDIIPPDTLQIEPVETDIDSIKPDDVYEKVDTLIILEKPDTLIHDPFEKIQKPPFHPDSVYTVKSPPEEFEKEKTVYPPYEPGDKYFQTHQLKTTETITKREEPQANDWLFPFLILSLLFIAFAKHFYGKKINLLISASFTERLFNQVEKEMNVFNEWVNHLLIANFILVLSLLVFQTITYLDISLSINPVWFIIIVFFVISLFLFLKYNFLKLLGWLFSSANMSEKYSRNAFIYNIIAGMIILPLVFINFYNFSPILLKIAWGAFCLINIIKVLRGIIISSMNSRFSYYHIFLYLCSLEIAPLFLLLKFSVNYANLYINI